MDRKFSRRVLINVLFIFKLTFIVTVNDLSIQKDRIFSVSIMFIFINITKFNIIQNKTDIQKSKTILNILFLHQILF